MSHSITIRPSQGNGHRAMEMLLDLSRSAQAGLLKNTAMLNCGRLRGTGPGVSFGAMVSDLEDAHPLVLRYPFEGSERVGGAVWQPADILDAAGETAAVAKLHWRAGADDLPMHAHEHADRFIVVLEGRGFFHWSNQPVHQFDGSEVRTIAARERDVFAFRRGLVHTFSTHSHDMTLVSVQSPFIDLDAAEQFCLPRASWLAREHRRDIDATIACDLYPPGMSRVALR